MCLPLPMSIPKLVAYIRQNHKRKTPHQMAEEIGVSEPTIYKYGKLGGLALKAGGSPSIPRKDELNERIAWIRKYGKDLTAKQIAGKLKVPTHKVYWTVAQYGLSIKASDRRRVKIKAAARVVTKYFNVHSRDNWLI
jgi:hypothetical protein